LNDGEVPADEFTELAEVFTADYREAPGLPSRDMARQLADIADSGIDPRRPAWRKWRTAEDYRVRLHDFDSNEIAVHAEPYTRGAGLLLWGFSCDARVDERGAFVIFLNTAHQPGAVAATVAHELGHYVYRSIAGDNSAAMAPLEANFVSHLEDESELFADSLAALSAYSPDVLRPTKPSHTSGRIDEFVRALNFIDPEYRIDFSRKTVSLAWRIRYLAATIHFYKLRKALLETAGI
jgi:hypothetical protein